MSGFFMKELSFQKSSSVKKRSTRKCYEFVMGKSPSRRGIGDGEKLINVVLLNGERLNVRVPSGATGQDLYNTITDHLGLTETIFFGLMIIKDGEHEFLDLNDKLSKLAKYAPHLWKDDVSCNSSLVFTIFFRVKYYVENICLLQQQGTRHLYYLQLRKDVLEGGIFVHEETSMLLASYALQAEVGDYNQSVHGNDYFVPEHYLPQRAIAKLTASYIRNTLPQLHKAHSGISDAQAEIEYLKEAQKLQEYGIIFNKVSKFKKDKRSSYSLGISVRGLIVFEERGIVKSPVFRHPWQNIKRMAFHRRRFFIEAHGPPETSKIVLYTNSYKKSRYLLKMCTSFYKFQMMMGMKLTSLREYPKDGSVKMNGVVKTDASDSPGRTSPISNATKCYPMDQGVIQQPGTGPAIQLNGSAPNTQDNVQVSVYPVQLHKINGGLGLNIIGGIELGGIYVKTMAPDGSAALSGKISIGDRILEINGNSLEGISRQDAVNLLRTAPQTCTLLIESCVAAPATPNGKPAVPGNYSTTAFHQPNRSQPYAGEEYQYQDPYGSPQHQAYASSYEQMGPIDQYSEDASVVSILAKNVLYFFGWEARTVSHAYSTPYGRGPGTVSMPGFQSRNQSRNQVTSYSSNNECDSDYYYGHGYGNQSRYQSRPPENTWRSESQNRFRTISMGSGRDSVYSESGYQSQVQIPSSNQNSPIVPDINETIDNRSRKGKLLELKLYKYEEKRESVDSSFFSSATRENSFDDFPSYESESRITEEFNPLGRRDYPIKNEPQPLIDTNENELSHLYSKEEPGFVGKFFSYLGFEAQGENDIPDQNYPGTYNDARRKKSTEGIKHEEGRRESKSGRPVEMKVFKRMESEDVENYHMGPCTGQNYEGDDQLRYQYSKTLQASGMLYQDDIDYGYYGDQQQQSKQGLYRQDKDKASNKTFDDDFSIYDDENVGLFGEAIEYPPEDKKTKLSKTRKFSWFSSKDSESEHERKVSVDENKYSGYRFGSFFSSDKRKNSDALPQTAVPLNEDKLTREADGIAAVDNKKTDGLASQSSVLKQIPTKEDKGVTEVIVTKDTEIQDQTPAARRSYFSWFSDKETEIVNEPVAKPEAASKGGFFGGFFSPQTTEKVDAESTMDKEMANISREGGTSHKSDAQGVYTVLSDTGIPGLTRSFVEEFEKPKTPPLELLNENKEKNSTSREMKKKVKDDARAAEKARFVDKDKPTDDRLDVRQIEESLETVDNNSFPSKENVELNDVTQIKKQLPVDKDGESIAQSQDSKAVTNTESKGGYLSWFTSSNKDNANQETQIEEERRGSVFGGFFSSSPQTTKQDAGDKPRKESDASYKKVVEEDDRRGSMFGGFFSSSSQQPKRNISDTDLKKQQERKTSGDSSTKAEARKEASTVDASKDVSKDNKETAENERKESVEPKEEPGVFSRMFKGVFGKSEPAIDPKIEEAKKLEEERQREADLKEKRRKERISKYIKEFSMKEEDKELEIIKKDDTLEQEGKKEDLVQDETHIKEEKRKERISKFVKEFSVKEEDKQSDVAKDIHVVKPDDNKLVIEDEAIVKEVQRKERISKFVKDFSTKDEEVKQNDKTSIDDELLDMEEVKEDVIQEEASEKEAQRQERISKFIREFSMQEEEDAKQVREKRVSSKGHLDEISEEEKERDMKREEGIREARRKERISQFIEEFTIAEKPFEEVSPEMQSKPSTMETKFPDDTKKDIASNIQGESEEQDDTTMKKEQKKERISKLIKEFSVKEDRETSTFSDAGTSAAVAEEEDKETRRKALISQLVREFSTKTELEDTAEISPAVGPSSRKTSDSSMENTIVDRTNEDYASIFAKEKPKDVPVPVFRYGWQREQAIFRPAALKTKDPSESQVSSREHTAAPRDSKKGAKSMDIIDIDTPKRLDTFEELVSRKDQVPTTRDEVAVSDDLDSESLPPFTFEIPERVSGRKSHAYKQGRPKSPQPFLREHWQEQEDTETMSYDEPVKEESVTDWNSYDVNHYETLEAEKEEAPLSIFDEAFDVPSEIDIEDQMGQQLEECFVAVRPDEEMLNYEYEGFQSEYQYDILDDQTLDEIARGVLESQQQNDWDMTNADRPISTAIPEPTILIPKIHLITDAVKEDRLEEAKEFLQVIASEDEEMQKELEKASYDFSNDIELIEKELNVGLIDEDLKQPYPAEHYDENISEQQQLAKEDFCYEQPGKKPDVSYDFVKSLRDTRRRISDTWDGIMKDIDPNWDEAKESSSNETVDFLSEDIVTQPSIPTKEHTFVAGPYDYFQQKPPTKDKGGLGAHGIQQTAGLDITQDKENEKESSTIKEHEVVGENVLYIGPYLAHEDSKDGKEEEEESDQEAEILKHKAERAALAAKQNEDFSDMMSKFKQKFLDEKGDQPKEKPSTTPEKKDSILPSVAETTQHVCHEIPHETRDKEKEDTLDFHSEKPKTQTTSPSPVIMPERLEVNATDDLAPQGATPGSQPVDILKDFEMQPVEEKDEEHLDTLSKLVFKFRHFSSSHASQAADVRETKKVEAKKSTEVSQIPSHPKENVETEQKDTTLNANTFKDTEKEMPALKTPMDTTHDAKSAIEKDQIERPVSGREEKLDSKQIAPADPKPKETNETEGIFAKFAFSMIGAGQHPRKEDNMEKESDVKKSLPSKDLKSLDQGVSKPMTLSKKTPEVEVKSAVYVSKAEPEKRIESDAVKALSKVEPAKVKPSDEGSFSWLLFSITGSPTQKRKIVTKQDTIKEVSTKPAVTKTIEKEDAKKVEEITPSHISKGAFGVQIDKVKVAQNQEKETEMVKKEDKSKDVGYFSKLISKMAESMEEEEKRFAEEEKRVGSEAETRATIKTPDVKPIEQIIQPQQQEQTQQKSEEHKMPVQPSEGLFSRLAFKVSEVIQHHEIPEEKEVVKETASEKIAPKMTTEETTLKKQKEASQKISKQDNQVTVQSQPSPEPPVKQSVRHDEKQENIFSRLGFRVVEHSEPTKIVEVPVTKSEVLKPESRIEKTDGNKVDLQPKPAQDSKISSQNSLYKEQETRQTLIPDTKHKEGLFSKLTFHLMESARVEEIPKAREPLKQEPVEKEKSPETKKPDSSAYKATETEPEQTKTEPSHPEKLPKQGEVKEGLFAKFGFKFTETVSEQPAPKKPEDKPDTKASQIKPRPSTTFSETTTNYPSTKSSDTSVFMKTTPEKMDSRQPIKKEERAPESFFSKLAHKLVETADQEKTTPPRAPNVPEQQFNQPEKQSTESFKQSEPSKTILPKDQTQKDALTSKQVEKTPSKIIAHEKIPPEKKKEVKEGLFAKLAFALVDSSKEDDNKAADKSVPTFHESKISENKTYESTKPALEPKPKDIEKGQSKTIVQEKTYPEKKKEVKEGLFAKLAFGLVDSSKEDANKAADKSVPTFHESKISENKTYESTKPAQEPKPKDIEKGQSKTIVQVKAYPEKKKEVKEGLFARFAFGLVDSSKEDPNKTAVTSVKNVPNVPESKIPESKTPEASPNTKEPATHSSKAKDIKTMETVTSNPVEKIQGKTIVQEKTYPEKKKEVKEGLFAKFAFGLVDTTSDKKVPNVPESKIPESKTPVTLPRAKAEPTTHLSKAKDIKTKETVTNKEVEKSQDKTIVQEKTYPEKKTEVKEGLFAKFAFGLVDSSKTPETLPSAKAEPATHLSKAKDIKAKETVTSKEVEKSQGKTVTVQEKTYPEKKTEVKEGLFAKFAFGLVDSSKTPETLPSAKAELATHLSKAKDIKTKETVTSKEVEKSQGKTVTVQEKTYPEKKTEVKEGLFAKLAFGLVETNHEDAHKSKATPDKNVPKVPESKIPKNKTQESAQEAQQIATHSSEPKDIRTSERLNSKSELHEENKGSLFSKLAFKLTEYVHENETEKSQEEKEKEKEKTKQMKDQVAKLPTVPQQREKALEVDTVKTREPKSTSVRDDHASKYKSLTVDKLSRKDLTADGVAKPALAFSESKPKIGDKEVEPTKLEQKSHALQQQHTVSTPKPKKTDESKDSAKSTKESAPGSQTKSLSEGLFSRFASVVSEAIQPEKPHIAKEEKKKETPVIPRPRRKIEKQAVADDGLFSKLGIFDDEHAGGTTPHEQPVRSALPVSKDSLSKEVGQETKMEPKVSHDSLHLQEQPKTKKEEQRLDEAHKADDKRELSFTPTASQHPKYSSEHAPQSEVKKESLLIAMKDPALQQQQYSPEKRMLKEEKPKTLLELVKAAKTTEKDTATGSEEVQLEQKENIDSHIKSAEIPVDSNKELESKIETPQEAHKLESAVFKQDYITEVATSLDEKPFVEELFSKLLFLETAQNVSEEYEQAVPQLDGGNTLEKHCVTETFTVGEASENAFIVVNGDEMHLDVSSAVVLPDFEKVKSVKTPIVEVNNVKTVLLQQTASLSQVQEIEEFLFNSGIVIESYETIIREIDIHTTRSMQIKSDRVAKLIVEGSDAVTSITPLFGEFENTRQEEKELDKGYVLKEGAYGSEEVSGFELPQKAARRVEDGKIVQEDEGSKNVESGQLEKKVGEQENKLVSSPTVETTITVLQDEQQNRKIREQQLQQQKKEHQTSSEADKTPKENFKKPLEIIKLPAELKFDTTIPKKEGVINLESQSDSNKDHSTAKEKVLLPLEASTLQQPKDTLIADKEKRFHDQVVPCSKSAALPKLTPPVVKKANIPVKDDVKSPENKEHSSKVKIVDAKDVPRSKTEALPTPTSPVVKKTNIPGKDDVNDVPRSDPRKTQTKAQEKPSPNKEESKPIGEGYLSSFVTRVLASPEVQQFKKTYLQKEEEEEEMDLEEMAEFYAKKNQEARIAQEHQASALKDAAFSPRDQTPVVDRDESDSVKGKSRKISRQEESNLVKDQSPRKTSMHSKGAERSKKRVSFEESVETKMKLSQHMEAKKHAESNALRSKAIKATPSQSLKEDNKEGTAQPGEGYFSRLVSSILAPSEEEIHLKPLKSEDDDLEKMALFYAKKNEEARKKKQEEALVKEQKDAAKTSKEPSTKKENVVPKTALQTKEDEQAKDKSSQAKPLEKETKMKPEEDTTKKTGSEAKRIQPKEEGTSQLELEGAQKESPSVQPKKKETQTTSKSYFSSLSEWLATQSQEPRQTEPSPLTTNDDANLEEMAAYYARKNAEARSGVIKHQPELSKEDRLVKETEAKVREPKQGSQNRKAQEMLQDKTRDEGSGLSQQQPQSSETRHQITETKAKESGPKETSQKRDDKSIQEVQKKLVPEETQQKKRDESQSGEGYLSKFVSRVLQANEPEEVKTPQTQTDATAEDKKLEEMAAYYARKNEEARNKLQEQKSTGVATQGKEDNKEKERIKSDSSAKKISDDGAGKLGSEERAKILPTASKSTEMASKKATIEQESKQTEEKSKSPQVDKEKEKLETQATRSGMEKTAKSKESDQPAETGYLSRFMTKVKSSYDAYQETQPQTEPQKVNEEEDLEKMAAFYAKQNQEARMALQKEEEKKKLQGKGSQESKTKNTKQQIASSQQISQARKEHQTSLTSTRKERPDTKTVGGTIIDQNVKGKVESAEKPKDATLKEKSKVPVQGVPQPKKSDTDKLGKRQKSFTPGQQPTEKPKVEKVTDKSRTEKVAAGESKVEKPTQLPKPADSTKVEKSPEKQKQEKPMDKPKAEKPEDKPKTEKPSDKPPETVSETVSGLMKWGRSMFK